MSIIVNLQNNDTRDGMDTKKISVVKKVVYMAMFIAITDVLSRFLSIQLPFLKITFSFIPIALAAMIFGPVYGGLVAGIEDLIGAILFPTAAFFPGFTLSAALVGVIYGVVLYKKPKTTTRFIIASTIIAVGIHIILNTLWLVIMYDKGFIALASTRVVKALIMIPVEVVMLKLSWKYIGEKLEKSI
ncbi:MAG: folate family ECF transporter S component [Clostridium sp.]